ncbi:MAG: type II toxin-antitoxin system VapC family toxin [Tepidisphaerales bacterium]
MFLDTSGLFCLLDEDEARHATAVALCREAHHMFTHNYVLAEMVALANVRGLPHGMATAFIKALERHPRVTVVWVDMTLHRAAIARLEDRPDKGYSLCDAVSFLCMEEQGIVEALTTDHHFEQERFIRLLKP